jgi:hypothetical protein
MLACVAGMAAAVPEVSAAPDIHGMLVPGGIGIIIRAAIVWYLLQAPSLVDSFTKK